MIQREITLSPKKRGFHLVTNEILDALPEIKRVSQGICFINILHTSASITLNECADPEVREDMESFFNRMVPDGAPYFEHTYEGADDMPAHIKSTVIGSSLTLPVTHGKFNLGTWQGIYLCEHRNTGGRRKLVVTIMD